MVIRSDVKSTARITLYQDGFSAFDSQADKFMERKSELHAGWLLYEIQRHLQLTKALLSDRNINEVRFVFQLDEITAFELVFPTEYGGSGYYTASYSGDHGPIERTLSLTDIHDFDGKERNLVSPVVKDIMDEIGRIFGLSEAPPRLWDDDDRMTYVKGLENQR